MFAPNGPFLHFALGCAERSIFVKGNQRSAEDKRNVFFFILGATRKCKHHRPKKKNASNVLVRKGKITRGSWFRLAEDSAAPPINLSGVFFPEKELH